MVAIESATGKGVASVEQAQLLANKVGEFSLGAEGNGDHRAGIIWVIGESTAFKTGQATDMLSLVAMKGK